MGGVSRGVAGWRLKPARRGSGRPGWGKGRSPLGGGLDTLGGAGAEARGRLPPLPTALLLHVPVVFLQAAHFESSEVVLVPSERRQGSLG